MGSDLIEMLGKAGVDTIAALNRFAGDSGMYERFLMKFLKDQSFYNAGCAVKSEDWDDMFRQVHTLKGVTGNLGLSRMYDICTEIVASLRAKNYKEAAELYKNLETAYNKICAVLDKISAEEQG